MRNKQLLGTILTLSLLGCADGTSDVEHAEIAMERAARSGDVFLEKEMQIGFGFAQVALFFGYYDNHQACSEFADAMKEAQPKYAYRCTIISKR